MAYVILKESVTESDTLKELIQFVSDKIGAIAKPKHILFTPDLPKPEVEKS